MSRLIKLRKWLTLDESAKHLSSIFEEEVTNADLLRLALERQIVLSVHFVNGAMGMSCKVVPRQEAQRIPGVTKTSDGRDYEVLLGRPLPPNGDLVIDFDSSQIVLLEGIWDLPLLGAETEDIELKFQSLINGPSITALTADGAFVSGQDGAIFYLQERIYSGEGKQKGQRLTDANSQYYPAGLPVDASFVIRTEELDKLRLRFAEVKGPDHSELPASKVGHQKPSEPNFANWAFATDFSADEAAALILGFSPDRIEPDTPTLKPVVDRMKAAYFAAWGHYHAMADGGWLVDEPPAQAPLGTLESIEMHSYSCRINSEHLPHRDSIRVAFSNWLLDNLSKFEEQRFSGQAISDWLEKIGHKAVFAFSTNAHNRAENSIEIDPADQPEELQIANIAFRAVVNGHGDQTATFKNRLTSYLQENFKELSAEAIGRISTVANPDKSRGRKISKT